MIFSLYDFFGFLAKEDKTKNTIKPKTILIKRYTVWLSISKDKPQVAGLTKIPTKMPITMDNILQKR